MISGTGGLSESACVTFGAYLLMSSNGEWPQLKCCGVLILYHSVYYEWFLCICNSFLIYLLCFEYIFWTKWLLHHLLPPSLSHFSETVRKSISEASISSPHADPPVPSEPSEFSKRKLSVKSQTCQDLGSHNCTSHSAPLLSECTVCHAWMCLC